MRLSLRQKSNIRYFVYYLVNGTLNFDLLHNKLNGTYHNILKENPELFYKTCCVFINQETTLNENYPQTKRLGQFLFDLIVGGTSHITFAEWETNYEATKGNLNGEFKLFVRWFIESPAANGRTYKEYIECLASFVEQCFGIWANVVEIHDNKITNPDYAKTRVQLYINAYMGFGDYNDLEDWECELISNIHETEPTDT